MKYMSNNKTILICCLLCLAPYVVTAATNIIQNGSFEFAGNQTLGTTPTPNELGGNSYECQNFGVRGVTGWSGTGRLWYHNAAPSSTFPDGDWCARIDASDAHNGVDVLAQGGLNLQAGRVYKLTFNMWGADPTTGALDVRFTYGYSDLLDETDGTGVTVLDEKTTDGNDNVAESVTVYFAPTVTTSYAVQFFLDAPSGPGGHVWVDNVQLIRLSETASLSAIENGSFETASNQTLGGYYLANELGGTATECGSVSSRGVTGWSGSGSRVWYFNEAPGSTFPDGDWCAVVDADSGNEGVNVLAQSGLFLIQGREYDLTFYMWGEKIPTTGALDVRFTYGYSDLLDETGGTGVTVLDEKATVSNDGVAEKVTVLFAPTVTADYALQFFLDSPSTSGHVWIDDVQLTWRQGPSSFKFR